MIHQIFQQNVLDEARLGGLLFTPSADVFSIYVVDLRLKDREREEKNYIAHQERWITVGLVALQSGHSARKHSPFLFLPICPVLSSCLPRSYPDVL